MTRPEAEAFVMRNVREILADRSRPLRGDEHLTRDLKIDSDDLTYLLVPAIERLCARRPTVRDWAGVGTINEVVDLLVTHAAD